ncbi:MAG: DEAD/DEAH box helicase family protein [Alphaproteobacteria bacterium]|nr:DEAD/DEAH box helicase family protein [Alphaproteobacteria bacterium]
MKYFDNITSKLKDDLSVEIKKNAKISIASAYFSIYAFQELKKQLEQIEELRFIFTSPTFITEKTNKEKREFYIPRLDREKSIYGTEFEVRLKNELTQKAIAKECADWIRRKARFKSNRTGQIIPGFMHLKNQDNDYVYQPINGLTTVDLGCDKGNNCFSIINRMGEPYSQNYLRQFNEIWNDKEQLEDITNEIVESITSVYNENSPEFIYFFTLYNIFNEFLEDVNEDVLPNTATGFKESAIWNKLYNFQKDACLAIINKLEKYNGCILADSVGLGKTFTALSVIKYYENRNKNVLVLCPKKLTDNWTTYKENYVNNPIATDRLRYDVLYHTDLSRTRGQSNGLDLGKINWSNYDLVVIDESHNFRNGGQSYLNSQGELKDNRYNLLLNKVIRKGVKTKVLMLSATPVNNQFLDLKNQLALAYEGNAKQFNEKLGQDMNVEQIFREAQKTFNHWNKLKPENRTTQKLLNMLSFDFFNLLDNITIARSRKHIERYYSTADVGKFPERLKPINHSPQVSLKEGTISYKEIFENLLNLSLCVYTPSNYIHESKRDAYEEKYGRDVSEGVFFKQSDREQGVRKLMSINLMKRMESSIYSFNQTLTRILNRIENTINQIELYEEKQTDALFINDFNEFIDTDDDTDIITGSKVNVSLNDMDYRSWKQDLETDAFILRKLYVETSSITATEDNKLQTLLRQIKHKIENPVNGNNKKIIIFTAFADTANYLYENVSQYVKNNFGLDVAVISGSIDGKSTVEKLPQDMNTVLTCFSPISKEKHLLLPDNPANIDILIATDCISEGQNLQDCDYLINFDIHWNPVRIIQRFGRIDRIGSRNEVIQLVNFWAPVELDEYIKLKSRVEGRMKAVNLTAGGSDNMINPEDDPDLQYRKQQLEKLQSEVIDIEEMGSGISIMDLGLNEFRLDLLEYIKGNPNVEKNPTGMNAVIKANKDMPAGVIYILKNVNKGTNINDMNRLHPFYMVYIQEDGQIVYNHLQPKELLDKLRFACKGNSEVDNEICSIFNEKTKDGKNMKQYSALLGEAINSIISVKDESDIDSLFSSGGTSALVNKISGLNDFELICFLVVEGGK